MRWNGQPVQVVDASDGKLRAIHRNFQRKGLEPRPVSLVVAPNGQLVWVPDVELTEEP